MSDEGFEINEDLGKGVKIDEEWSGAKDDKQDQKDDKQENNDQEETKDDEEDED